MKLTPTKDVLNLIATETTIVYKRIITYATLIVRKPKANPTLLLAHEKALLQLNAKYRLKESS